MTPTYRTSHRRFLICASIVAAVMAAAIGGVGDTVRAAQGLGPRAQRPRLEISSAQQAQCLASGDVRLARHPRTGVVRFVGTDAGRAIPNPQGRQAAAPEAAARAYLSSCGALFGIADPTAELRTMRINRAAGRRTALKFQQLHAGLPVVGGELVIHVDDNGSVLAVAGRTLPDDNVDTTARITASAARTTALDVVAKRHRIDRSSLVATEPAAWIYNPELVTPYTGPSVAVWRVEVTAGPRDPIRELVLVDEQRGAVVLAVNQVETVRNRETYTALNTTALPGVLVCNETDPSCVAGDRDAASAHRNAGDTYDFYSSMYGRDSIDGLGMVIQSTVHYDVAYANAFWNGSQMVYGDAYGFALADDVVGHELTHGVTQYNSNLFYFYQSGAINESLSDVFGELIDQTNGHGDDSPEVKWLIGEDIEGIGAIRDMKDPTRFANPDRMTSELYDFDPLFLDNGGVHSNSGINNKAAFLMVDGGAFNGRTVLPLGVTKVAKIYYEVQTHLLTSGSDYADLYNVLYQGCVNLIGSSGITVGDCQQVRNATDAVEMNLEPVNGFNPDTPLCPTGKAPSTVFFDGLEAGSANWTGAALSGTARWGITDGFAHSGVWSLYASDSPQAISDSYAAMTSGVVVPPNAYLHFSHAYGFDPPDFDGGVVEFSNDNGASWTDAAALFDGNGYGGSIEVGFLNPLAGRLAFVGDSHGYVSSRLNLASLAGQTVRFRWRMGTDYVGAYLGWVVDDVRIYTCQDVRPTLTATPDAPLPGSAMAVNVANSPGNVDDIVALFRLDAADTDYLDWAYINGTKVAPATGLTSAVIGFTAPAAGGQYNFRLFRAGMVKQATSNTFTVPSIPALIVNDVAVAEGNSGTTTAVFTVALTMPAAQTVTVDYATADGTAQAGSDYTAAAGTLTFAPGVTSQTVAVVVNGDTAIESDETFTLNLSNAVGAPLADSQGVGTIVSDDAPPPPVVAITTPVVQPAAPIAFTVTNGQPNATDWVAIAAGTAADAVYLDWMYLNGTKTAPTDGLPQASLQFTAPSGKGVYNIRLFKGNSTTRLATSGLVTVTSRTTLPQLFGIDAGQGSLLAVDASSGTATSIALLDFAPATALAVDPVTGVMYAARGAGNPYLYQVNKTTGASTLVGDTHLGAAGIGALVFGQSGALYASVNLAGDDASGSDHLAVIDKNTGAATVIGSYGTCVDVVVPSIGGGSCTVEGIEGIAFDANGQLWGVHPQRGRAGTPGLYRINTATGAATFVAAFANASTTTAASAPSGGIVSVQTSCDGVLYGGTAAAIGTAADGGRLVVIDPATGRFQYAGSTSATAGGSLAGLAYSPSCVTAIMTNPTSVAPGGAITVTVANGPANPTDWVGLFACSAGDNAYMNWWYLNGSKTAPATGLSGATLTIAAPATPGTYCFRMFANNTLTRIAASAPVTVALPPTLTINDVSVTEGNSGTTTATFTVSLSPVNATQVVKVDYATANGTAQAGSDYVAASGTLTFAPGTGTQTVAVTINGDVTGEPNETFSVNLSNAINAVIGDAVGVGTILNDEPASVSIAPSTVATGGTITVTVSNGPGNSTDWVALFPTTAGDNAYVDWMYLNGLKTLPATGVSNATLQFVAPTTPGAYNVRLFQGSPALKLATSNAVTVVAPTVTITSSAATTGGTIAFTVSDGPAHATDWVALFPAAAADNAYVNWMYLNGQKTPPAAGIANATLQFPAPLTAGTYNIRLFASNTLAKLATSGPVTVSPPPTLTINDVSIAEGNSGTTVATFTVTLNPVNAAQTVTVGYATADGTARAGSDYAAASGTLTFAPGTSTQTIAVTVNGDTSSEPNETFIVTLANAVNALIGDAQGVATIVNDDVAPPPVVTIDTPTVSTGATIRFTVTNAPGNATDWVGLFASAASDTAYLDWEYLNGTKNPPAAGLATATLQFVAPMTPGTYNVRLFQSSPTTKLATSGTVTVVAPTVTVTTPNVLTGGTITFTVADGPANATDWVGLHSTTAGDNAYLDWVYLNGSKTPPATGIANATLQFVAPKTPGTYNVRLFRSNSTTKLATSNPVTVTAPTISTSPAQQPQE